MGERSPTSAKPAATPLEALAAWVARCDVADIPDDQLRFARLRILDSLGLVAAAADLPVAANLRAWCVASAPPGSVPPLLADCPSTTPAHAAIVHGTLAHARDFDDTFPDSVVHPGSTIVATALSIGAAQDAELAHVLAAIAIGYEIAARLGGHAGRAFHARGFHATGIVGPLAAAATACALLGHDAEPTADAMALATSQSSGLLAFLADGGWSKWLHCGWAAQAGIMAAELAGHGIRGPRHALDHDYGLYGAFAGITGPGAGMADDLGQSWRGSTACFKYYPCAHVIQPYIDAVIALRAAGLITMEGVARITCMIAPWAVPIVCEPRARKLAPQSDLDAIASLPLLVAAALHDGRVDLATIRAASSRAELRAAAERVHCEADPRLGRHFDGAIRVATVDGHILDRTVGALGPDEAKVTAKFDAISAAVYAAERQAAVRSSVLEGAGGTGVRALVDLCRHGP